MNPRTPWRHFGLFVMSLVLFFSISALAPHTGLVRGQSAVRFTPPAQGAGATELPPHPLLGDRNVRRALAHCTDRRALLGSVYPFLSSDERELLLMDTFIPKTHWAYQAPPMQYQYSFDPAIGSQLLEAAGWILVEGDLYRRNSAGYELAVELTTTNAAFRQVWASLLEEQWRSHCGIRLLRTHLPAQVWFGSDSGLARRDFELGALSWVGQADPGGYTLYACDQIPSAANRWEGQNAMGWCNPIANDAIILANNSLIRETRISAYGIVQEEFAKDMVSLPIFQRLEVEAWSRHLQGVRTDPTEYTTASAAAWSRTDDGDSLVLAFSQEPGSMHSLVQNSAVQSQLALMAIGVPNTQYNYDVQPVLQKALSTIESGLATNQMVAVAVGDTIYSADGGPAKLAKGIRVIQNGAIVEYDGESPLQLPQLIVTYSLNPYTWSDGTPGSIADVELAYRINCDPDSGATSYATCDSIQDIEYRDGGELEWTVTYLPGAQVASYYVMPFSISPKAAIYPSHQVLGDGRRLADVPAAEWETLPEIAEKPLSYGPFYITEWIKGQRMTLRSNPHYGPGTGVQSIVVLFVSDSQIPQLSSGDVDYLERNLVGGGAEAQTLLDAADQGQVNAETISSPTWEHIDINLNLYAQAVARRLPATGGEVESAVGYTLTVPSGLLPSTGTAIINDLPVASQGLSSPGALVRAFSVELLNAAGEPVSDLAMPLTLIIGYSDQQLGSLSERSLNIARWDGEAWVKLLPCEGCRVDEEANQVIVRIDHLSAFVLTGQSLLYVPAMRR